ncbi:acyl-CoA N-acyltransferase [Trichoderma sp. SZMC 28014]
MTQSNTQSLPRPVNKTFVSEKLVYRSVQMSDLDTFYQIISEPGCMEMGHPLIPRPPTQKSMDEFVESYQKKALIFVFICLQEKSEDGHITAGKPIGSLNMSPPSLQAKEDHRSTSFSIWLLEEYRGQGYGEEATKWAMDWAFNYAGVHRIELWSFGFNEAAIRLWEKIGFKLEGRKRENVWFQRRWFDTVLYSILEQEWEKR